MRNVPKIRCCRFRPPVVATPVLDFRYPQSVSAPVHSRETPAPAYGVPLASRAVLHRGNMVDPKNIVGHSRQLVGYFLPVLE
jgi:hypothetical protein